MQQTSTFRARALATTALCLALPLLAACAAGPDFKNPAAPGTMTYGPYGMPLETASANADFGGPQRFKSGGDVPAAWWRLFESASLNHLMDQAIAASPSLEAAKAALRAAEENAAAAGGSFFPSLSGSAQAQRSKSSGGNPFTLYNTSVSLSYAPDIFGAVRRGVETKEAQAEAAKFEVEAAYLTLTSNIATTAIQEASLRGQIAATRDIIAAQKKQLDLTQAQFDAGAVAKTAILTQSAALASTQATLPALEKQLAQTRYQLAALTGRLPSEGVGATFELSSFKLPAELPLSLPSLLVEQRPDIRAARANLHAANAQIGVAMAAMMPQFPLTASYGVGAGQLADMFSPGTAVWGLGAGLLQPLFKGGELLHTKRAAEASFDQAAAQYRATVLAAFQDVANALKAIEMDAEALKAKATAERAAAQALDLTTQQFNAGAVSYIALLTAQASYQQSKIALIQANATRLADTAALFQSLGGGWWQRGDVKTAPAQDKTK